MAQVDATVIKDSGIAGDMQRGLARSANVGLLPNLASGNTIFERRADYYVHVFNISKQAFPVNQPLFKSRILPACPDGQDYIEVAKFPNVVVEKFVAAETGQIHPNEYSGEQVAMDLIRPANPSIDMDADLSNDAVMLGGATTDLVKRGLFITRGHDTPTEDDLRNARRRLEKWYRQCISEANALARTGKHDLITAEMHLAAEHFKSKESWHAVAEMPQNCPNCGEDIKRGVAFHKSAEGMICVIDWKRTVAAGVKTKKEVPEELRWWEDGK